VHDFWSSVIGDGYLLNAADWMAFEGLINHIIWPSGIGRLPDNVSFAYSQNSTLIPDHLGE